MVHVTIAYTRLVVCTLSVTYTTYTHIIHVVVIVTNSQLATISYSYVLHA